MSGGQLRSRDSQAVSLMAPLALIGATVAVGLSGTPALQGTVTLTLASLIIVLGLQVFIGNSGIYSFGQLGFAAAGGYLAALLTLPAAISSLQTPELPSIVATAHLGALSAIGAAGLAGGAVALVVGLPLMRTSTLAIPISTFAFLVVTYNVLANWDPVTGGSSGLVSIPRTSSVAVTGLWAAVAVVVALTFKWSASGYRLQATREDEVAAHSIGIVVMRERLVAFVLSGVLCGIGGAIVVHQSGVLNPNTFYFGATVTAVTMLVVGGARSVFGAVAGAIAVTFVNEVLRGLEDGADLLGVISIGYAPGLAAIGLGVILLATMILRPEGLSGGREAGEFGFARRLRRPRSAGAGVERSTAGSKHSVEGLGGGILEAKSISVSFGGLQVLREVDLRVERGEILGLIGPNGAGKTTLVNVLSGYQRPDSGTVELEGVDVSGHSPDRLARSGLARTFQAALPFAHLSGLENVAVGAMGVGIGKRRAVESANEVLGRLGLIERAGLPAEVLAPGQQRLLGIARALATGPGFMLLDEPAAGLSEEECEGLVAALRGVLVDFGSGIVLIEHEMNVVMNLCQRIQVLDEGGTLRIGSPEEIRTDPAVIAAYLGTSFETDAVATA